MIESIYGVNYRLLKDYILLIFFIFFSVGLSFAQNSYDLNNLGFNDTKNIEEKYIYNPELNKYIISSEVGDYPITYPLVLTVEEFEALVLKKQLRKYFNNKIIALSGKGNNIDDLQKNLLPESYVNKSFFQSFLGKNLIDISPQGSIGIDLGIRYQKNDNPATSPRDRENFGFDFDQRISLSILGKIGDRLQITANYDTESTFDFQNLKNNLNNLPNSRNQIGNQVSDYLKGKVTEDAIIQNIDIGNISMPINSNLIQGAQSLFGVRADLKFGKTEVSGIFSEQRSQSQNITTQGGGTIQEFSLFALDYEEDRHYFLSQYFRENYDKSLKTYPYINSGVQINRIEVWVTNRGAQTQNVRNIIAIQDLAESNPNNTTLDKLTSNFFNNNNVKSPPSNNLNRLDPDKIGQSSILNNNIRDISKVKSGFTGISKNVKEGFDYVVLESARKLNPREYTFHPQLGYISLNQRLSNDEILAVAFQYTYLGKVYQVGEFANGDNPSTVVNFNQEQSIIENNNLIVKMLKSSVTDVNQPVWNLMMKNIYNIGAFQLSEEGFRLNILYSDPSPINYLSPVENSIWPENLEKQILLNTFDLDRLNKYQDLAPKGDGFFDYVP